MRRRDRQITDRNEIMTILDEALVCRIALVAEKAPYIVPLNFGYTWNDRLELFFHGAAEGRKFDLIRQCTRAGFEIDASLELAKAPDPCNWGMNYKSIIGYGTIELIEEPVEKQMALDSIMRHFGFVGKAAYQEKLYNAVATYKLVVEELTAKKRF